jgi:hypothetical protein
MRRNNQARLETSEPAKIIERFDLLGSTCEIYEEDVATLDGSLDAGEEHDAALRCVRD